jgi:hypothetical protein
MDRRLRNYPKPWRKRLPCGMEGKVFDVITPRYAILASSILASRSLRSSSTSSTCGDTTRQIARRSEYKSKPRTKSTSKTKRKRKEKKTKMKRWLKYPLGILAWPFMACVCFYHVSIADRDPWGADNHPRRTARRERRRRERERRERMREIREKRGREKG